MSVWALERSDGHRSLVEYWRSRFKGVDLREIWELVAQEGKLPAAYAVPGAFDVSTVPFAKDVFRALRNPLTRDVSAMAGVQCIKTLIGELWIVDTILNSPGSFQWLLCTDKEGEEHLEERVKDLLEGFPAIRALFPTGAQRHEKRKTFIKFRNGMFLRVEGVDNPNNLQRKSIKYQMRSEVWQRDFWRPGKIKEASSRQTQFVHNSKSYTESQAGWIERNDEGQIVGDDWLLHWLSGSQKVWSLACVRCGRYQAYEWDFVRPDGTRAGMRWDDSARTRRADGTWIWGELAQTVRYECIYCGERHADDPVLRRRLSDNSKYISQAPDAGVVHESFTWNQLCVLNLPWFETKQGGVKNYLLALDQFKKGNRLPLQEFRQKVLCGSWDDEAYAAYTRLPCLEISGTAAPGNRLWPKQEYLWMTIDVQEHHFWFLVIAFSKDGEFCVYEFGKKYNWADLRERQLFYKVADQDVGVDCGHNQTEVFTQCVRHGHMEKVGGRSYWLCWKALRGTDERDFLYVATGKGGAKTKTRLPYAWPPQFGDPCIGRNSDEASALRKELKGNKCPIISWSNPSVKDVAKNLRGFLEAGTRGHMLKGDWNEEFSKQMYSESKRIVKGAKVPRWAPLGKRPNHGWDCFNMAVVRAFMKRVFVNPLEGTSVPANEGAGEQ